MKTESEYRCEAASVEAFVQHVGVTLLRSGYVFYVTGVVPKKRRPCEVDAKMIGKYGIVASKFTRARRKRAGLPNAHYLRHGDFWVCLTTVGHQKFFAAEGKAVRDARKVPIKYGGYAVGFYEGKPSIRLDEGTYLNLRAYLEDIATKRSADALGKMIYNLPFRPYRGVRTQLFQILDGVNAARAAAGLDEVPKTSVRFYRKPIRIFSCGRNEPASEQPAKGGNAET
jgi:hypothetical protein